MSDNVVSNESSYLQVAHALSAVPKGLCYIGVGPEQNFSYLAELEPKLAFIVDCRRDNLTLHLLYKALFEEAQTRTEWLSLLCGCPSPGLPIADSDIPLESLLAQFDNCPAEPSAFLRAHARVKGRLESIAGLLSRGLDWRTLKRFHLQFFRARLDVTFQLHKPGRHTYPTLRSLLLAKSPGGSAMSFLASRERYEQVRRLQLENRIIPVVGDFSGHRAFAKIAQLLRHQGSSIGVLYASNVEQMVWEERRFRYWFRNVCALPFAPSALIVRAYIDQGRAHPMQMSGHRTTTLCQPAREFLERAQTRSYRSHSELVLGGLTREAEA